MTGALLAVALTLLVGVPLALALPASSTRISLLVGEGYLLGAGTLALLLMAMSVLGITWSIPALAIGAAFVPAAAIAVVFRRGAPSIERPSFGWPILVDLLTLVLVAGFIQFALAAPSVELDYLAIWGLKGKVFWLAGGIDWPFLETPLNMSAHPDYPILVPLVFVVQALLSGAWPEQWMGIITAAFGIAALVAVRGTVARERGELAGALVAFALMPLLFSAHLGLAEGPLIAYGIAALLWMRRAVQEESGTLALRAAVYLGFAASCKNEGATLLVAAAIALLAARCSRLVPQMWPAVAIAAPWWILRGMHDLSTDLLKPGMLNRLGTALSNPAPLVEALMAHPVGQPLFWLGVTAACLLGWRRIAGPERFLTVAILLQLLFFIGAYLVTPNDIAWHVKWSWERIVRQLMPAVALLAVFSTLPGGREGSVAR